VTGVAAAADASAKVNARKDVRILERTKKGRPRDRPKD